MVQSESSIEREMSSIILITKNSRIHIGNKKRNDGWICRRGWVLFEGSFDGPSHFP